MTEYLLLETEDKLDLFINKIDLETELSIINKHEFDDIVDELEEKRSLYVSRRKQLSAKLQKDIYNGKYPMLVEFGRYLIVYESTPIPMEIDKTLLKITKEYMGEDLLVVVKELDIKKMYYGQYLYLKNNNLLSEFNIPLLNLYFKNYDKDCEIPSDVNGLNLNLPADFKHSYVCMESIDSYRDLYHYKLDNYDNLQYLSLVNCGLFGFQYLFKNLKELYLNDNKNLSSIMVHEDNYTLKKLDISNTKIPFNNSIFFKSLEHLMVNGHERNIDLWFINKSVNTSSISNDLKCLECCLNKICDDNKKLDKLIIKNPIVYPFYSPITIFEELSIDCKALTYLDITSYFINVRNIKSNMVKDLRLTFLNTGTPLPIKANVEYINNFKTVENLELNYPQLSSDISFRSLTNLISLTLSTHANFKYIKTLFIGLSSLTELNLRLGTVLDGALDGLTKLKKVSFKECRINNNVFKDQLLETLIIENLHNWSLDDSLIKDQIKLKKFVMNDNTGLDKIPKFSHITSLTHLELDNNDSLPYNYDTFKNLQNLVELNIISIFNLLKPIEFPKLEFLQKLNITMHYNLLGTYVFKNLPNLTYLEIKLCGFRYNTKVKDLTKESINEDMISDLTNLEHFIFIGGGCNLTKNIFKKTNKIKFVILDQVYLDCNVIQGLDTLEYLEIYSYNKDEDHKLMYETIIKNNKHLFDFKFNSICHKYEYCNN